ncbi:MAG: bifunctional folylpolyglutamate synthase/dihydrofolate synthase [Paenibacillaceae bacterium]|nr:bifunctional folylpolyglutamate synthase/dihydrofolate synthase [Paenibacillaceae bacterium]
MSIDQAIAWLTSPVQGMRFGLERMRAAAAMLDHPERTLRFIHVAGTNGKGSTCAMIDAILRRCGYNVGLYTSPYIVRYQNRVQYNGADIPDDVLVHIAAQLIPLAHKVEQQHGALTSFELGTLLALVYYARHARPDVVVWETGLGGRLDATNVVDPLVSVITTIGFDHMDVLGHTLPLIASEKAGIIKSGVPIVSGVGDAEAAAVIAARAHEKDAPLFVLGDHFSYRARAGGGICFSSPDGEIEAEVALEGPHQLHNASLAMMAMCVLRTTLAVGTEHIREGLRTVRWPGRCEWVTPRLLIDGAHNVEGMRALARIVHTLPERRVALIGMVEHKDHRACIEALRGLFDAWVVTETQFFKRMDAHALGALIASIDDRPVFVEPSIASALARADALAGDCVVACGSLYVIGEIRAHANGVRAVQGW